MKTINELFESRIARLCAMIAGGMLWIAGYNLVPWCTLTPSDWGTWVGAIGTVGALIGTILLANKQNKQARDEELNLATLVAASVLPQVIHTVWGASLVLTSIERATEDGTHLDYLTCCNRLRSICNWNTEQLMPLSVVPNHAAFHLENARGCVSTVANVLSRRAATHGNNEVISPRSFMIVQVRKYLRDASHSLEIAHRELEAILPSKVASSVFER